LSGDPQVGAFSPSNVFAGSLTGGATDGFILYWLFMWWLGGFGILILARHLRAPVWGGCVVALGFLFCGIYTGNAEHTSWLIGFSFCHWLSGVWTRRCAPAGLRLQQKPEPYGGLSALSVIPALRLLQGCMPRCARYSFPSYFSLCLDT
jgi:hypothetical protein